MPRGTNPGSRVARATQYRAETPKQRNRYLYVITIKLADVSSASDSSCFVSGLIMGRDSSVGIATGYGLDGPGNESQWG